MPVSWPQNIQDNSNGTLGSTVSGFNFREEFDGRLTAAITSAGLVGKFYFSTMTNASVNLDSAAPTANTYGFVNLANTGAAAPTIIAVSSQLNIGTADYYLAIRTKIVAKARLGTVATPGFKIGCQSTTVGFIAGNDNANWYALKPGGGTQVLDGTGGTVASPISDATWYVLECIRLTPSGGTQTLTYYINGTAVYSLADSTSMATAQPCIVLNGLAVANGDTIHCDYIGITCARPTSG